MRGPPPPPTLPPKGGGRRGSDGLVHRDEPLRRIAEDDRLLRSPRMRILMLELSARDQHSCVDQRLNDGLVGIALFTFFGEDALACKTRSMVSEATVSINCVRNGGVD